ncbi:MAG: hypothetical protein ACEPOV_05530 [Hyphomicrobiales bacterium]
MEIKLRQKTFISFLKKFILKLKDKLALYPKQTSSTIQTNNAIIAGYVRETITELASSSDYIGTFILMSSENIQKKRNIIIVKWNGYINTIRRFIKSKTLAFNHKVHSKYNALKYFAYHRKPLATEPQIQAKRVLGRLIYKGESFFSLKQIEKSKVTYRIYFEAY